MTILEILVLGGLSLVAVVVGNVAHEWTHVAAVKLFGGTARWQPWPPAVTYSLPDSAPEGAGQLVGLAPLLVGELVGLCWLAAVGLPKLGQLPLVVGWVVYMLASKEDLDVEARRAATKG